MQKYDAAVVASLALQENNDYFNALLWVTPDGCIQRYDKRHLFSIASESELFTVGKSSLLVEYKGWKFMPLICYDPSQSGVVINETITIWLTIA